MNSCPSKNICRSTKQIEELNYASVVENSVKKKKKKLYRVQVPFTFQLGTYFVNSKGVGNGYITTLYQYPP
jgi:hypothetical protein